MLLHEFIQANDGALIQRVRSKSASRSPTPGSANLDGGIPLTEFSRQKDDATKGMEVESLGRLAHELRNKIQTVLLSYRALKSGKVGVDGSTGAVLGRSLVELSAIIDKAVAEVRRTGTTQRPERMDLLAFVGEVATGASLLAEFHNIAFHIEEVPAGLAIEADRLLLASALMNLLQNAFKFTRQNGGVTLRTRAEHRRVFMQADANPTG
jgi:signal transduction histidine kinase